LGKAMAIRAALSPWIETHYSGKELGQSPYVENGTAFAQPGPVTQQRCRVHSTG
jgi:hypothetical protein